MQYALMIYSDPADYEALPEAEREAAHVPAAQLGGVVEVRPVVPR